MDACDYRSPRHRTALRSAGTGSATGNLPSKVTVSPAAPRRAQIKTKSSKCLQGLIQRPLKPKTTANFNPFTSDQAYHCPTHSFDLIYIFIYQLSDFLKSVSTAPTELLNSAYIERSPLKEEATQPGEVYLASCTLNHQGPALRLGKRALPMPSSLPIVTSEFAPYRLRVHCSVPNGNTELGPKTGPKCSLWLLLSSPCSWGNICPSLLPGNGTSHRHFTALQICLRKRKQTNP